MQLLYKIEAQIKDLSYEDKREVRLTQAMPVLVSLGEWMKQQYIDLTGKSSATGKALAYCISRWDRLSRYTEDGRFNIDNNLVENSIRPVALGKKNYLFLGSHEAATRSAMLYSLFGTCKLHGLDPYKWLTEVLSILPNHPINRISELLPQNWGK